MINLRDTEMDPQVVIPWTMKLTSVPLPFCLKFGYISRGQLL